MTALGLIGWAIYAQASPQFEVASIKPAPASADKLGKPSLSILGGPWGKLGATLESKKCPVDILVIDHVEKTSAEN